MDTLPNSLHLPIKQQPVTWSLGCLKVTKGLEPLASVLAASKQTTPQRTDIPTEIPIGSDPTLRCGVTSDPTKQDGWREPQARLAHYYDYYMGQTGISIVSGEVRCLLVGGLPFFGRLS